MKSDSNNPQHPDDSEKPPETNGQKVGRISRQFITTLAEEKCNFLEMGAIIGAVIGFNLAYEELENHHLIRIIECMADETRTKIEGGALKEEP